ncbi:HupE/UreJ family protein [Tabrizicola sp.]|jgi:urease accessory protein|uniref:HupE/UreJ family protein n=1 Tax=Tabrizicola sp. TaxID=2005166 RepID=UPI001A525EB0|nr:HupE/UreJ family protein [Tabrizicola sp.]MBL9062107.1 HupE/UreJ family protein [Tabrizicola sp.]
MKRILIAALSLCPLPAMAHGLHDSGTFLAGALHPVGGLDHVLAMIAVGLLAAQLTGRALWALPVTFVTAMLLGGAVGAAGLPFPLVEPMILASIVILGVLVALACPLPLPALVAMVALFGGAHGWAHGAEGPATGLALYALGFAGATAALHLVGIALGRGLPALALRGLGAGAAVAGLALVVV